MLRVIAWYMASLQQVFSRPSRAPPIVDSTALNRVSAPHATAPFRAGTPNSSPDWLHFLANDRFPAVTKRDSGPARYPGPACRRPTFKEPEPDATRRTGRPRPPPRPVS